MSSVGLRDEPVTSIEAESLGLKNYVRALGDLILGCDTPMTIALQGDWGSGKTSLINMIREYLRTQPGTVKHILLFNAWEQSQFGQTDTLAINLMSHIIDALSSEETKKRFDVIRRSIMSGLKVALVTGASIAVDPDVARRLADLLAPDAKLDPSKASKAITHLKNELAEAIKNVTKDTRGARIVIFIDDLDRLVPSKAVDVLEAVKLFLDAEGCVFVLACDYSVVSQGIAEKFGRAGAEAWGKNFFDKIIQVPFTMPVHEYDMRGYCGGLLRRIGIEASEDDLPTYVGLLSSSLGSNPRSLKRVLNWLLLLSNVHEHEIRDASENGASEQSLPRAPKSHERARILFAVLCMQQAYPALFRFLRQAGPSVELIEKLRDESALETDPVFESLRRLIAPEQQSSVLFCVAEYAEWLYRALQFEDDARGQRLSDFEVQFLNDAIRSSGTLGVQESSQRQPTNEDTFLNRCNVQDRGVYESLLRFLKQAAIPYRMGVTGFSIQARAGRPSIAMCFPSESNRRIELMVEDQPGEKIVSIREMLSSSYPWPGDGRKRINLGTSDVPPETLCRIIEVLAGPRSV
jgi:hypothetical protein